jgi:dipeptidase D
MQIHEPLANAIKVLTRVLNDLQSAAIDFRVASISGGSAHNAIPRDATASVVIAPEALDQLNEVVAQGRAALQQQWQTDEPDLQIEVRSAGTSASSPDKGQRQHVASVARCAAAWRLGME